jgi:hypothetical protein
VPEGEKAAIFSCGDLLPKLVCDRARVCMEASDLIDGGSISGRTVAIEVHVIL